MTDKADLDERIVQIAFLASDELLVVHNCHGGTDKVAAGTWFKCRDFCKIPGCWDGGWVWTRIVWAGGGKVIETIEGYLVDHLVQVAIMAREMKKPRVKVKARAA